MSRRHSRRRAGFTILEVMVAMSMAFIVVTALLRTISSFNSGLADIFAAAARNTQMDEAMRLLLWGRYDADGVMIPGLWQLSSASPQTAFPHAAGRAFLSTADQTSDLGTPRIVPTTILCHAANVPLPDCGQADLEVAVTGHIHVPPAISSTTAILDEKGALRTRQLTLVLFDPPLTALISQTADSTMTAHTATVTTHAALRFTD